MIRILLTLTIISSAFSLQAQKYEWAFSAGNNKSDKCITMRTDALGYVYAAGYFGNNIDLGINQLNLQFTNNNSSKEVWLAKFDSTGFCYWAISGGRYFDDRILGMDVDPAGNCVVTGTYWHGNSGFDFNGYIIGAGGGNGSADQGFVAKVNTNGVVQWGHVIRSNQGDDQGMDVAIDRSGNVYTCGFMVGNDLYGGQTQLVSNTTTGSYEQPYWVTKQDAAGNFLWAKTFGNLPYDSSYGKYVERDIACCVDEDDNIYITGGFDHTRVFGGTSLTSTGHYDCFLISYDGSGAFRYAKNFGSRKKDWCNGICSDNKGSIYLTGEHRDSIYYDNQFMAKNYDGRDVFVLKINAVDGSPVWGARAGRDVGGERGNDIVADTNCNVYVAGDINNNAKFGDNIVLAPNLTKQSFVARITPDGKWKWAITGGGPDDRDRANAIALGVNGQIYTGGFMRSASVYGSSTLNYNASSDLWIARVHDSSFNKSYGFDLKKPDNREFCFGGSTTAMDIPTNDFFDYTPKTGVSINSGNTELTFAPDTTTTYSVYGYRGEICRDYDTVTFTVVVHPYPVAAFAVTPKEVVIKDPNFQLINQSQGATQYEWYFNNGLLSTNTDENFTGDSVGNYCFTLVAKESFGCADTTENCGKIYKINDVDLIFPNAFSPNNDGKNEIFKPFVINKGTSIVNEYRFIVFDRWGQKVFETNDVNIGWQGTITGGEPASMGTYFYSASYKKPNGSVANVRGDVNLIR